METKNVSGGGTTQPMTPFGTAPIPAAPSLKQTSYDGALLKDRYLIEGELGRGGIGVVYLARDTQLHNRRVVVKVLLQDAGQSLHTPWFKKKFEQEIEALVRLDHPGIVGVLDAGTMPDGKQFFVMQFVEGQNLRSLMREQPLSHAQIGRIIRQLGYALTAAHDKGIVHRDLKPENIMVQRTSDGDEMIKLIDFGIATVKDSTVATQAEKTKVAGALPYMAPEQLRGQPDASSDIWALGVMAYEMLTGQLPFHAETLVQLHEMQRQGIPVQPQVLCADLSETACAAITRALAFDPNQRYRRAKDFGDELLHALSNEARSGASAANARNAASPAATERPRTQTALTHSARTEVDQSAATAEAHAPVVTPDQPKPTNIKFIAAAVVAVIAIGLAVWLWQRAKGTAGNSPPAPAAATMPARLLSYSFRVRDPQGRITPLPGEVIFSAGDELRIDLISPQDGYIYLVNEGPELKNGLPAYNILFPHPEQVPANTPSLRADQSLYIPQEKPPWLLVDNEPGAETLWLVWSERPINELESVKKYLLDKTNPSEIKEAGDIKMVQGFLNRHYPATKPTAEKDEQTHLKGGKDGLLVYPVRLAHR